MHGAFEADAGLADAGNAGQARYANNDIARIGMSVIQWSPAAWGDLAAPPAALTRTFSVRMPPAPLVTREPPAHQAASTRTRLWEITPWMHCSIIGTCLSTTALHHLLVKLRLAPADVDDHAAHKIGVTIAARSDVAGKLLHKTLDTCHRLAINRFARAHTEDEVRALWRAAVDQGDIPGAYWAVMTHPASSRVLLGEAFGDVGADGIPLWWKKKFNLDVNDVELAQRDLAGDGYTVIEKYLDGLDPRKKIDWSKPQSNVNALTLRKLRK